MATIRVRGSNMPGVADEDAMARLQRRCMRDLKNVATVGDLGEFIVSSPDLDRTALRDRLVATVRTEFRHEPASDWWTPDKWLDLS